MIQSQKCEMVHETKFTLDIYCPTHVCLVQSAKHYSTDQRVQGSFAISFFCDFFLFSPFKPLLVLLYHLEKTLLLHINPTNLRAQTYTEGTGQVQLLQSLWSARFSFELYGISI